MGKRADLLVEVDEFAVPANDYYSDWIDSGAIYRIRVTGSATGPTGAWTVEESVNGTDLLPVVGTIAGIGRAEFTIIGRMFRIHWTGGSGATIRATVRAVPGS